MDIKMVRDNIKLGLASLVLAASIGFGIRSGVDFSNAGMALRQNTDYNKARVLEWTSGRLEQAKGCLESYLLTGRRCHYPEPAEARKIIFSVLPDLDEYAAIKDTLMGLYDSLPNEEYIREFNGKRVDDETFSKERSKIEGIQWQLDKLTGAYMSEVPRELVDKREFGVWSIIVSMLASAGSFMYGLFRLGDIKRKR